MKRFLLASSVGRPSRHRDYWLSGSDIPEFDVLLVNYDSDYCSFATDDVIYRERKGSKFENLDYFIRNEPELFEGYDFFYFPDEDIEIDTKKINRLFHEMENRKLYLAAPAYDYLSVSKMPQCFCIPCSSAHTVYYIEVGNVAMSRAFFNMVREDFGATVSGFGIDLMWGRTLALAELPSPWVFSSIPCRHPERVSTIDQIFPRQLHPIEAAEYFAAKGLIQSASQDEVLQLLRLHKKTCAIYFSLWNRWEFTIRNRGLVSTFSILSRVLRKLIRTTHRLTRSGFQVRKHRG